MKATCLATLLTVAAAMASTSQAADLPPIDAPDWFVFLESGRPTPADPPAVEAFIAGHRPLPPGTAVCDAPFWSPAQAQFLREQMQADADWTGVVDSLAVRLSA